MAVTPNAAPTGYNSAYTGPQIDAAVGAVIDKETAWDAAAAGKLPAGGEAGQILEKTGAEDNAAAWLTPPFLVRPNLLDNWYFVGGGSQLGDGVFPINQRGQSVYTGSVPIVDKWSIHSADVSVTLDSDGIALGTDTPASNKWFIKQYLVAPSNLSKKTLTLSALFSGSGFRVGFRRTENGAVKTTYTPFTSDSEHLLSVTFETDNIDPSASALVVVAGESASATLKAVKLEISGTQTLAKQEGGGWVINELPDYWEELDKCKYYYERISGQYTQLAVGYAISTTAASFNTFVHPKARGNRTVSLNGSAFIWHGGVAAANGIEINSINNVAISDNGSLYFTSPSVSGLTVGEGARLQLRDSTSYLEISVN